MEHKLFNESENEISKNLKTFENLVTNCAKLGISIIEIPLVDSSSLKTNNGKIQFTSIVNSKVEGDMEINNETIFPIWSMSKPITIVDMMILRERGMISINDNLSKYIHEFKNMTCKGEKGKYPCKKEIKIIHLLTHRSGFGYLSDQG